MCQAPGKKLIFAFSNWYPTVVGEEPDLFYLNELVVQKGFWIPKFFWVQLWENSPTYCWVLLPHLIISAFFFLFLNYICKGNLQNVLAAWIKTVKRSQLLHSSEQISDRNKAWIWGSKALKYFILLKHVLEYHWSTCSFVQLCAFGARAVLLLRTFVKKKNQLKMEVLLPAFWKHPSC